MATRYNMTSSAHPAVMAPTSAKRVTPAATLHATMTLRLSQRSATRPPGRAAIAAEALLAPVRPAMTRGFRDSVNANSGTATANKPSPLAEMPVAHQRRLNAPPSDRRPTRTDGVPLGAPTALDELDAARSTDANCTTSQQRRTPRPGPVHGAGRPT